MQQSVGEISTKDIDEIIDAAPSTTNIGGMVPLRQDTKAELDKLLDKEYVYISALILACLTLDALANDLCL